LDGKTAVARALRMRRRFKTPHGLLRLVCPQRAETLEQQLVRRPISARRVEKPVGEFRFAEQGGVPSQDTTNLGACLDSGLCQRVSRLNRAAVVQQADAPKPQRLDAFLVRGTCHGLLQCSERTLRVATQGAIARQLRPSRGTQTRRIDVLL
jgi:hypothetical protein